MENNFIRKKNKGVEYYQTLTKIFMYLGPVFGVLALICGLGYNHYSNIVKELKENQEKAIKKPFEKNINLTYDEGQLIPTHIIINKKKHVGFMLYNLTLVNGSNTNLTIRKIYLSSIDNNEVLQIPQNIVTDTVFDPKLKSYLPVLDINFTKTKKTVTIVDWINIRDKISEGRMLMPGETISGSAYFILPNKTETDIFNIKTLSITVEDFYNNKSITQLKIPNNFPKMLGIINQDSTIKKFYK